MTITVAPDRSDRAAALARRIVKRFGDDELANDLLELLVLVSDPDGDAPRAAMKEVYANSGMIEAVLDDYCRRIDAREVTDAGADEHLGELRLPSAPSQATALVDSDLQLEAH